MSMKNRTIVLAAGAVSLAFLGSISNALAVTAGAPPANGTPLRHLVYTFTWGSSNNTEVHTSGMGDGSPGSANGPPTASGSASGISSFNASVDDKGTITVDVLREQPNDHGLVVAVSEQANNNRSAVAATCVVFGNTDVICDPNAKINYEELTLLRFLGANFVDPNQIDAKQHWKVGETNGPYSVSADYTIASSSNGQMKINEDRIVSPTKTETSTINSTIGYDFNRQLPVAITEYSLERRERGEQYVTVKMETVLSLQTDSMAGKT
jgi:hypothetical protein